VLSLRKSLVGESMLVASLALRESLVRGDCGDIVPVAYGLCGELGSF